MIAAEEPDLIGLQEVTNWIAQGDPPGRTQPAELRLPGDPQAALEERGLDYRVAAVTDNADIGPAPLVALAFGCAADRRRLRRHAPGPRRDPGERRHPGAAVGQRPVR